MLTQDDLVRFALGVDPRALPEPTPEQIKRGEEMRAWLASRPQERKK